MCLGSGHVLGLTVWLPRYWRTQGSAAAESLTACASIFFIAAACAAVCRGGRIGCRSAPSDALGGQVAPLPSHAVARRHHSVRFPGLSQAPVHCRWVAHEILPLEAGCGVSAGQLAVFHPLQELMPQQHRQSPMLVLELMLACGAIFFGSTAAARRRSSPLSVAADAAATAKTSTRRSVRIPPLPLLFISSALLWRSDILRRRTELSVTRDTDDMSIIAHR